MTKSEYLLDPCRVSSLPYWKTVTVQIPEGMRILHESDLRDAPLGSETPVRYFRLIHRLCSLERPAVPEGYTVTPLTPEMGAAQIQQCYDDISVSAEELAAYQSRKVYDGTLWLAVREHTTGKIVASGIGELDRELKEGMLEWIQVSLKYRRKGLGAFLVRELLWRMKGKTDFVTVSGKVDDPSRPEQLYRSCGFTGNDIWYISRK